MPVTGGKPEAGEASSFAKPPQISLPKGGGAIRGMGEKFAANPVTGTGSVSVPIATSPGRSGFGPQLSLSYDSGAGNGPFGFGWSLSIPSITRKTDKGLPQYRDVEESDIFILSGVEDLVPVLVEQAGKWVREVIPDRTIGTATYKILRFRPRTEGLFALIESWARVDNPHDVHWRSISKDNILTLYGGDADSRIADPLDPTRIFSWLICETRDDKGNAVLYRYKAEDGAGVDLTSANERNRGPLNDIRRTANCYLKHIYYGNRKPLLDNAGQRPPFLGKAEIDSQIANHGWMFEVVFDYQDHDVAIPKPKDDEETDVAGTLKRSWLYRHDPFSTYRSGFEVRTTRLCQRVLMFHHFPDESGVGADCLVRSTDFAYSDEQDPANARNPVYTFLQAVTQTGYKKRNNGGYDKRSLPPAEFEYTRPIVRDEVHDVDSDSLESLPIGVDGSAYQWADLHGEGIPGILTEQADTWFYKRNLSPASERMAEFAPLERVASKPNLSLAGGAQIMDLAGDGQPDLVVMDGSMPGLYEHDTDEGWQPFRPFTSRLNRNTRDPNLRFVDLDGDGHADVLISEDDAFVWHASLAEEGFGPARRVAQALDEEKGPRLVFADGTQSIYLSDMSGDGLADLVRIRNGEVCYWPNMGYCRFGAKVTMDNAPHFDNPDQFDHKRIGLADIDGSGTTDIIYLHRDGVRLYFNQSGNSWSAPQVLRVFPRIDDIISIAPTDLLGNGTACLVWSSPLPGDERRQMRYVDLMGGQKPHLLIKTRNNLGAVTEVEYAPSTKFYLKDKQAGKPWLTKLPFPVHVVEKVTVTDKWRKTRFSSTYSYHHGYFDGTEREFCGFGRVEQVDVETFDAFEKDNAGSPSVTKDQTLYQPPIKTVTWFHTGLFLDRKRILSHYSEEYFPRRLEDLRPNETNVLGSFLENILPEPDLEQADLAGDEWREALRACKGMTLRQESYELDVGALKTGEHVPVKLFSTAYHNVHIHRLQPRAENKHAVFHVTESEAVTYHYELDLRSQTVTPDPRIAHMLNLKTDEFGNVLQAVAVVYPRIGDHQDTSLSAADREVIGQVQKELHLAYTETHCTNDVNEPGHYRLRLPCEAMTYDLTGIGPKDNDDSATPDVRDDRYFTLDELRRYRLSEVHQTEGLPVAAIPYQEIPNNTAPQKRLVEHARTLYFDESLTDPLPFREMNHLGLVFEQYKLALTNELLSDIFDARLTTDVRNTLANDKTSGYLSGSKLATRFMGADTAGQYWIRSGTAGFEPDAPQHFYLPERYIDPFGNETTLTYDGKYDLFVRSSADAYRNTTRVERFDYRVLAPSEMVGINGNHSEVAFDILGMVVASAVKGKRVNGAWEGDNLDAYTDALSNPPHSTVVGFCTANTQNNTLAEQLLGDASARFIYHFGEHIDTNGNTVWHNRMAGACGIVRERHASQVVLDPAHENPLQISLECSDGAGNVLMKKAQAEPDPVTGQLRWIVNGLTVLNNKGKPVKQYEPAFSDRFGCELPGANGVTPIMYYDAPGRLIRTEMPDGSFSRVEISPWHVTTFDPNDTVLEAGNQWFAKRTAGTAEPEDIRAAQLAAVHAGTAALTILDSLGREVIAVAHNRIEDVNGTYLFGGKHYRNEYYLTFTRLDAEGKPLWIRDARKNLVMQYIHPPVPNNQPADPATGFAPCYDIAGNLLFQRSMDAGDRWMLNDAAGKPMLAWDINETPQGAATSREDRLYATDYDQLHRPTVQWLTINSATRIMAERYEYQDAVPNDVNNLNGQLIRRYDPSGCLETARRDFKGNVREIHRTLNNAPEDSVVNWQTNPAGQLESDTYVQITEYDALNRMTRLYNWHRPTENRVAIYLPRYNERGVLQSEELVMRAAGYDPNTGMRTQAIAEVRYNAKGQKEYLKLGNGTLTQYDYDPLTFRLRQLRTTRPAKSNGFPQLRANLANPNIVQQLLYTCDPVGNITEIEDQAYKPVFFSNAIIEPKCLYEYDALYRLTKATGRENGASVGAPSHIEGNAPDTDFPVTDPGALRTYTQIYTYDPVGNIERMKHQAGPTGSWTRDYAYAFDDPSQPASNRLRQTWTGGDRTQAVTYGYDTHGNMQNLARTDPRYHLQWDHRDMIKSIDLGGGGTAHYQYDTGKQRTRKRIVNQNNLGGYWERIYLGGYERYRRYKTGSSAPVEEIESHHLLEGEQRVLLVDDVITAKPSAQPGPSGQRNKEQTLFRYQYSNHLGSACLELDHQAEIISYEEYHPYGTSAYRAMKSGIEAPPNRYRYTGKERDGESGLYYYGARYYAAWLGRWVSADPAGLVDGINCYEYGRNNPVKFLDRVGTSAISIEDELAEYVKIGMEKRHFKNNSKDDREADAYRKKLNQQFFEQKKKEFAEARAEESGVPVKSLVEDRAEKSGAPAKPLKKMNLSAEEIGALMRAKLESGMTEKEAANPKFWEDTVKKYRKEVEQAKKSKKKPPSLHDTAAARGIAITLGAPEAALDKYDTDTLMQKMTNTQMMGSDADCDPFKDPDYWKLPDKKSPNVPSIWQRIAQGISSVVAGIGKVVGQVFELVGWVVSSVWGWLKSQSEMPEPKPSETTSETRHHRSLVHVTETPAPKDESGAHEDYTHWHHRVFGRNP